MLTHTLERKCRSVQVATSHLVELKIWIGTLWSTLERSRTNVQHATGLSVKLELWGNTCSHTLEKSPILVLNVRNHSAKLETWGLISWLITQRNLLLDHHSIKKTLPREGSGINNFTKSNRLIALKKQLFKKIWFKELGGRFRLALFDSFIYIDWAQTETNWYLFGPNRNRIVPVITETFRFRFGKWWNLKSSSGVIQKEITN